MTVDPKKVVPSPLLSILCFVFSVQLSTGLHMTAISVEILSLQSQHSSCQSKMKLYYLQRLQAVFSDGLGHRLKRSTASTRAIQNIEKTLREINI